MCYDEDSKKYVSGVMEEEFRTVQRYCFVLTDAELPVTPEFVPHICDNCGEAYYNEHKHCIEISEDEVEYVCPHCYEDYKYKGDY